MSGRGPRFGAFNAVILVVAALITAMALTGVERSVRAATADGGPGRFTAERVDCTQHPGHESCTCYGEYLPDDGSAPRTDVYLYGRDRETCRIGTSVAAVDIGSRTRVYGPEGSREWLWTAGMALAGLGLGAWSVRPLLRRRGAPEYIS
jgi:hypothetical protein